MATIDELKGMASAKFGFARSNRFLVELPSPSTLGSGGGLSGFLSAFAGFIPSIPGIVGNGMPSTRELDVLCTRVTMPGKQVTTIPKQIGMEYTKVAYGYAVDDVSLTFYLLNDYGVKRYFDYWVEKVVNQDAHEVNYSNEYSHSVTIHQLRTPQLGFSKKIGPINLNLGLGSGSVYSVKLNKAFPTSVQAIELSNELDGLVELTVQLSYTNWSAVEPSQNFINLNISPGQIFG